MSRRGNSNASSSPLTSALRALRSRGMKASRTGDEKMLISIGVGPVSKDPPMTEEEDEAAQQHAMDRIMRRRDDDDED